MPARVLPTQIEVRGARVNNLRSVDVDLPLNSYVAMTGVSGSGKSSLALGVLYAEGSRRYLDGLSSYQRRRISQAAAPDVDSVEFVPAALALRQRPSAPGPRSTVATLSEVGAALRLSMSRLGTHLCPNGHGVAATPQAWVAESLRCPEDGLSFHLPSAESFSSASVGACPRCEGLGVVSEVDPATLITDPSLSIDEGAVAPWRLTGRMHMPSVVRELGVPTDVPFRDLSPQQQHLVLDGPVTKQHVVITSKNGRAFEMDAVYESATQSVLSLGGSVRSSGERHGADRFLRFSRCPDCEGSGLGPVARSSTLLGHSLPQLLALSLSAFPELTRKLRDGVDSQAPDDAPAVRQRPALLLAAELLRAVEPLLELGLGYLQAGRRGETLSTGERQRMELAATAMRRTTGMLYVLDEPTVGLHPAAVAGLVTVMNRIVETGNSLVVVDHDVDVLRGADWLVELGPGAGQHGGTITAQGTPQELAADSRSVTGPYLSGAADPRVRPAKDPGQEWLQLRVGRYLSLQDVELRLPQRALSVITGVSGAGKSALIVDSLVPAVRAQLGEGATPEWVDSLDITGLRRMVVADSTPIGANARSTPATYSGIFDTIRQRFARTDSARSAGHTASYYSYNSKSGGRCPTCEGLGQLSLDLQYLPDLTMVCSSCHGGRYAPEALTATVDGLDIAAYLSQSVDQAAERWGGSGAGLKVLRSLQDVGLGYLTLGEPTPALSGGEAQRLRLAAELGRAQAGGLFVFDEPTIGLHPQDVRVLVELMRRLVDAGGTVVVIEHDLDLIANADWLVDVGPGGGAEGGRIVAQGSVSQFLRGDAGTEGAVITPWLRRHLGESAS
ncbi:excinuclease ABC subunit UvrA [Galactobacter caseinivorans]|uniref:UvrABC system protein A n=1 Tax=Galactobacter caseinivorans TaxID=2676123 RepID=A0A496PMK4_9MICC|nr:excinuclease ABC subunit UvrA [Galactobacter caseinivorans]RKW71699.1 excinuclease ABC subunit UvrA [Galactobacter caseinivorans]